MDTRRSGDTERIRSTDGTEIAVERAGSGRPLVCVHGTGASREQWRAFAGELSGFECVRYDRRGRGDSGDAAGHSLAREVDDARAVVERAGDPSSVAVFGHSFGGIVAFELARELDLGGLVCYEPPVRVGDRGGQRDGFAEHLRELHEETGPQAVYRAFYGVADTRDGVDAGEGRTDAGDGVDGGEVTGAESEVDAEEVTGAESEVDAEELTGAESGVEAEEAGDAEETNDPIDGSDAAGEVDAEEAGDDEWEGAPPAGTIVREARAVESYGVPDEVDVSTPALLCYGTESPDALRDATRAVADALPESRLATFDGYGHVAIAEAPGLVADRVEAFLGRCGSGTCNKH